MKSENGESIEGGYNRFLTDLWFTASSWLSTSAILRSSGVINASGDDGLLSKNVSLSR